MKSNNKSSQENGDKSFPGYLPYPPEDDITRQGKRVAGTPGEDAPLPTNASDVLPEEETLPLDPAEVSAELDGVDEFDVTGEDLEALGPKDLSLDLGEDEQLKHRTQPVDFSASNLDVPGSELDDDMESTGSEDEENNSYSIGGDNHDDLADGKQ